MTPHYAERLDHLISEFIAESGLQPSLFLVVIGANGAARVSQLSDAAAVELCATPNNRFTSPLVITVISGHGDGRSALVEITAPTPTLQ